MASRESHQIRKQLFTVLLLSSAVSIFFFVVRVFATQTNTYWFMVWNLILAWVPLGFCWLLMVRLKTKPWLSPLNIIITFLWLGFLPNAFYIASDIIHLPEGGGVSYLFDVVMLLSFSFNGFLLGYLSLYGIHNRLRRRLGSWPAASVVAIVLLLCSFAIYLGRYLRWNSWDVIINPAGIIFDISDGLVNPVGHPQLFTTTAMFFVLLGSIYVASYQLVKIAKHGFAELDR